MSGLLLFGVVCSVLLACCLYGVAFRCCVSVLCFVVACCLLIVACCVLFAMVC